ncbi:MAG: GNAT family N-acetyltransferase [Opitutales bacterium]|nr:GNAT family N-acetyltransferase [Opitutales bacterium]
MPVSDPNPFRLRRAEAGDVSAILGLIRELAVYEHLEDQVEASEDTLRRTLFGPHPYASVILAEADGQAVGYALFFHNYSTFLAKPGIFLEDLFVKPAFRKRGIGKALLIELARIAEETGCGRFEWMVLDWNAPSIAFYEAMGARKVEGWSVMRVTGKPLSALASNE